MATDSAGKRRPKTDVVKTIKNGTAMSWRFGNVREGEEVCVNPLGTERCERATADGSVDVEFGPVQFTFPEHVVQVKIKYDAYVKIEGKEEPREDPYIIINR